MKKFIDNLKAQAEANPLAAMAAAALLFTATAKLLDANTARSSARTHALEVNRRIANSNR
jgi:hypothetical protein